MDIDITLRLNGLTCLHVIRFHAGGFRTTRILTTLVVALSLCLSTVVAADAGQPQGTWKLRSQRTVSGTPPSFSPGLMMTIDATGNLIRLNDAVPAAIIGHDRMKFSVSADGRILTQDTKGLDQKTRKPYRYVLTWDKQ